MSAGEMSHPATWHFVHLRTRSDYGMPFSL